MRVIRLLLVALAIGTLASSPPAIAKEYAPPGKAGTSEYAEDIPSAGGNVKTPAMGGANKTATEIDHLGAGKQGVSKLAKLGKAGAAAALFAQQTAPATQSVGGTSTVADRGTTRQGSHGKGAGRHGAVPQSTLTANGQSAIKGVGDLIGGSDVDGIGILLPLLLAFGAIGAAVVGVVRLRHPRSDAP